MADIHKAVWQNRVDHQAENWIACFPNVLDDSNTIDHYFWLNSIDCLSDAVEVISIYAGLNPDPIKNIFQSVRVQASPNRGKSFEAETEYLTQFVPEHPSAA